MGTAMSNDFDEFCNKLGREVPIYRTCPGCEDIFVVDPTTYEKPKTICDPGECERVVPYCVCKGHILFSERNVKNCDYPDCAKAPPIKKENE